MNPDHARALAVANHYRKIGLSPLPSLAYRKAPALETYDQFYGGEPIPESVYESWNMPNIQVIAGTKHPGTLRVVVVDLDGDEAPDAWRRICQHHQYEPTSAWVVETGSGGLHYWYRLPASATDCPSGLIWGVYDTWGKQGSGDWLKHKEVRVLGDRALIVSPPSIHVETGKRYHFMPGASPLEYPVPEVAPAWLLAMPRLCSPSFAPPKPPPVARLPEKLSGRHYMRQEVLDAIPDKVAEAKALGLRLASQGPNPKGWVACYVPWREDCRKSDPSGSMHADDGTFQDRKDLSVISFFDLCNRLQPGSFPTWIAARDYFGDRYIGRIAR